MKVTINVTPEHIDRGERGNTAGCAIALACKDGLNILNCAIGSSSYSLNGAIGGHRVDDVWVDPGVGNFISDFDHGQWWDVRPFSFDMYVPEWAVKPPPVVAAAEQLLIEHKPELELVAA